MDPASTPRELWSRSASAASASGKIAGLQITDSGDLQIINERKEVIWHTQTEVREAWISVLNDNGWADDDFDTQDLNGWERFYSFWSSYRGDEFAPYWMI